MMKNQDTHNHEVVYLAEHLLLNNVPLQDNKSKHHEIQP